MPFGGSLLQREIFGKIEGWEKEEGKVRETRLYPLLGWGGKMCEWSSEGEVFHLAENWL